MTGLNKVPSSFFSNTLTRPRCMKSRGYALSIFSRKSFLRICKLIHTLSQYFWKPYRKAKKKWLSMPIKYLTKVSSYSKATNLKSKRDFKMGAAITNLSTCRVFTSFACAYSPSLCYCFLWINVNRIQYNPLLHARDFSIHVSPKEGCR